MSPRSRFSIAVLALSALTVVTACDVAGGRSPEAQLLDNADGHDWPGFGRTYGEQHFSPLTEISDRTVGKLGLAWSMDLEPGNSVTGPIAIGGTLYFARFYSVVNAVDAATGKLLWTFDPKAPEASGERLRQG
ncbi:MAG TPA: PQQ-dependent dehydrogenase, methanol/ethanol family, partial [Sphingomicrobium sp.]